MAVNHKSDLRKTFNQAVFAMIRRIPAGHVMTYGGIARKLDPPEGMDPIAFRRIGPRWVGYALSNCPDDVPWHRVINSKGAISPRRGLSPELQQHLLEAEGVVFSKTGRINLKQYEWSPEQPEQHG